MRNGTPLVYVTSTGTEHDGMATAVTGTGESGYKIVSLVYGDGTERSEVPHENDANRGHGFWRERNIWSAPPVLVQMEEPPGGPLPSPDILPVPSAVVEALAGVSFASEAAEAEARERGLSAADFADREASGASGYTKADVIAAAEGRERG